MTGRADYELWQAIHDACSDEAKCCAKLTIEFDDETWAKVRSAAYFERVPLDAFIHLAIAEGLRRHMRKSA